MTAAAGPARLHVAILRRPYLDLILLGHKTAELRLTRRPIVPWRSIAPGERVHLKLSGGTYAGVATVRAAECIELDGPAALATLRDRIEPLVQAGDEFWAERSAARFATVVHLAEVRPCAEGPNLRRLPPARRRAAWHALPLDHPIDGDGQLMIPTW